MASGRDGDLMEHDQEDSVFYYVSSCTAESLDRLSSRSSSFNCVYVGNARFCYLTPHFALQIIYSYTISAHMYLQVRRLFN